MSSDAEVLRIHAGKAWADVAFFGSTVIAWHPSSAADPQYSAIFLSKDTKPGKAYRGGIPLVFPVFGEVKDHGDVPDAIKNCSRHGFCRDRKWTLVEKDEGGAEAKEASVTMSLSSDDEPALLEKFPCAFKLLHSVTLTADSLETSLRVQHTSSSKQDVMPFHALFHTYLAISSGTAQATGLKGVGYNDKVAGKIVQTNDVEQQGWAEEIDRVYQGGAPTVHIAANDGSGNEITLKRTETLPDTTLWNPGQAADSNMGDLHDGGWREFVCAEPGHVASFAQLEKGKEWVGTQTLTFKSTGGKGSSPSAEKTTAKETVGEAAGAAAGGATVVGGAAAATKASKEPTNDGTDKPKEKFSESAVEATCKEQYKNEEGGSDAAAARVIQRNYRKYVKEREANGMRLSPDARWGDAVGRVRLDGAHKQAHGGDKNDATNRWKRGGLMVGQLAGSPGTQLDKAQSGPVEGGPSLSPNDSLSAAMPSDDAPKREESHGMVGDVPGAQQNGKVDNIRSIAEEKQYGLKIIERWTRGAPAQELSKVMEAQYWLEMVDRKHRYGSNLKYYHAAWEEDTETKDNFFKWLDEGAGKELSLSECPRDQLEREQITYLSAEQRANYIVDVKDGKLVWRRNGKFVDTTRHRWRDMGEGRGIVELGDEEKAEQRRQREERAAQRGHKLHEDDSSSSSSSSSDDDGEDSEEEENKKARARHYGGAESQPKRGLRAATPAGLFDKMLRKTVAENTWIYVYNSRHELFVGLKKTGTFQHSSFLYGGRVLSAGLLKANEGKLTSLSPLSGHYRAGTAHFRFFVASLQDSGVNLSRVTLSKSLLMLHGLEAYGKLNKKLKGGKKKDKKKTEKKLVNKDGSEEPKTESLGIRNMLSRVRSSKQGDEQSREQEGASEAKS